MKEISIDLKRISIIGLLYAIPLVLFMFLTYKYLWPESFKTIDIYFENQKPLNSFSRVASALFPVFVLFVGIIAHEFIHILFFVIYNKKGWSAVKVGFDLKTFTPYAHCSEPVKLKHYIISSALPGIVLGLIPFLVSLAIGNPWLWMFGLILSIGGIGDFIIISKTRKIGLDEYVMDHPKKVGFVIV